jgi:hypothetical protein
MPVPGLIHRRRQAAEFPVGFCADRPEGLGPLRFLEHSPEAVHRPRQIERDGCRGVANERAVDGVHVAVSDLKRRRHRQVCRVRGHREGTVRDRAPAPDHDGSDNRTLRKIAKSACLREVVQFGRPAMLLADNMIYLATQERVRFMK